LRENRITKKALYMDSETRLRARPRNRWQDEVREDGRGRQVGGKGLKERVYNRKEWKKLLRTARNCCILHMPME
jgi:ribosomal protein L19E